MFRQTLVAVSMMAALAAPAFGEGLTANQIVEKAVLSYDTEGNEVKSFVTADEFAPGDELRYSLTFVNEGETVATNVRLVMPIPTVVDYVEGSVEESGATIEYSSDNGETFADRDDLIIAEAGAERPAAATDITHIRWTFSESIEAGETGNLSYRGVLQ